MSASFLVISFMILDGFDHSLTELASSLIALQDYKSSF